MSTSRAMSSSVESFARLLQASRVFFRHHKSSSGTGKTKWLLVGHRKKSLLLSERVDKAARKKYHPGSLEAEEKLNGMCKANCARSSGVEKKKGPRRQSIKSQHQKKKPLKKAEEKAVEKKPNDFESTDADRITCKGTHYFTGA